MSQTEDFQIQGWSDQLKDILKPHLFNGFQKLFRQSQKINPTQACKMFQLCLSRIPELPLTVLDDDYQLLLDYNRITPETLHNMIVGTCASYAKMNLVSHGANRKLRIHKRDLAIPDNMTFIHRCYIEAARELYECTYLLSPKFDRIKLQENADKVKAKIEECIQRTLMKIIPFQHLHQKYIKEAYDPASEGSYESRRQSNSKSNRSENNGTQGNGDSSESGDPLRVYPKDKSVPREELDLMRALNIASESAQLDRDEDLDLDLKIKLPCQFGGAQKAVEKEKEDEKKNEICTPAKDIKSDKSSFEPGKMLMVKSRLSRANLDKLQRELDITATNDTRKSKLLEQLMVANHHKPADPQSTLDLSLDSNQSDRINADELESLYSVPSSTATSSEESAEKSKGLKQTGKGKIVGSDDQGLELSDIGATGLTGIGPTGIVFGPTGLMESQILPKVPRIKRITIRPHHEFEIDDLDMPVAETLGLAGPTVVEMPITDWKKDFPA